MLPLEMYWPPEMLARVFPEKYRHLIASNRTGPVGQQRTEPHYTVQRLSGGCVVYWLGERAQHRGAS
jgi:hypothetical protein